MPKPTAPSAEPKPKRTRAIDPAKAALADKVKALADDATAEANEVLKLAAA